MKRAAAVSVFVLGACAHVTASAWRFLGRACFDLHDVLGAELRREREAARRATR